jgi:hypothetical protein
MECRQVRIAHRLVVSDDFTLSTDALPRIVVSLKRHTSMNTSFFYETHKFLSSPALARSASFANFASLNALRSQGMLLLSQAQMRRNVIDPLQASYAARIHGETRLHSQQNR